MTADKSKNDQAWEIIFKEEEILNVIASDGFFEISSTRINQQREARLMTKFDHSVQLPQIFKDHNLTIQPTSRGNYIIGTFESYFQLPEKTMVEVAYRELPANIETLEPSNIYSESSAIICAFLSGMIDDVLGETTNFTVLGRMSTGTFDYKIRDQKTGSLHNIKVTNSQCEIDGGFEGESQFAIIEAKSETINDFIIRQLYYPYRLWNSKIEKEVVPIFLTISNDIFTFYRFHFSEEDLYNSLKLVSEHRYCISKSNIEISDIRSILAETKIVSDDDQIPFPQADSFPRIIDLLGRLYSANEFLSKDEITLIYAFEGRQTHYYVTAAIYLGLVMREDKGKQEVRYSLSEHGYFVMSQHPQKRNIELIKCILQHRIFHESLAVSLEKAKLLSQEEIVVIMAKGKEKIARYADDTRRRRASSVSSWIKWILELPMGG
ncbi:MAG: translation elongation factor [Microcystaceae cyanobacterium]